MELNQLGAVAILIVFFAIVATVGINIVGTVQDDAVTGVAGCNATARTACGYDYNATVAGIDGLDELAGWTPLIALVVAAAVVISVLLFLRS